MTWVPNFDVVELLSQITGYITLVHCKMFVAKRVDHLVDYSLGFTLTTLGIPSTQIHCQ